jgi:CheY-like chemotaxis protein
VPDMTSIRTNKSILAVDDELDIVNLMKQSLDMSGFKVRTFTNALAALEHFKSNSRYYDRCFYTKAIFYTAVKTYNRQNQHQS